MSNNIINSGQNPPRAGGKFNSVNSHKFNGQVRNGGGPGKFSNHGGNNYYGQSKPTSQFNIFSRTNPGRTSLLLAEWRKIPEVNSTASL